MCLTVIGHISLVAAARFGLRLSRTCGASLKLIGLYLIEAGSMLTEWRYTRCTDLYVG
jgi:hypothetical protein